MSDQEETTLALVLAAQLPDDLEERSRVLSLMEMLSQWRAGKSIPGACPQEACGNSGKPYLVELRRGDAGASTLMPSCRASGIDRPSTLPK